jgi:hypothetical protein
MLTALVVSFSPLAVDHPSPRPRVKEDMKKGMEKRGH